MPDPVSCHPAQNDPAIIECDPVFIGPKPDRAPATENKSAQPGVRALVAGHEPPMRLRTQTTVEVPLQVHASKVATGCAGEAAGFVLGIIAATKIHPALGVLTVAKVGWDIGQCIGETMNATERAVEERAIEDCIDAGGTSLGTVNGTHTCEMPVEEE